MSQQHMEFEGVHPAEQRAYAGYEGTPPTTASTPAYSGQSYGQKIGTGSTARYAASVGQRMALAIISLVLWVVVFFVSIGIGFRSYDSYRGELFPFLLLGLLIFSGLIIVINVLFNRKYS